MNIIKKIFMPSGEQKAVDGLRSWMVKWKSYNDTWSTYAKLEDETEIFIKEEDAKAFAEELRKAFRFTKSSVTKITITENKQS